MLVLVKDNNDLEYKIITEKEIDNILENYLVIFNTKTKEIIKSNFSKIKSFTKYIDKVSKIYQKSEENSDIFLELFSEEFKTVSTLEEISSFTEEKRNKYKEQKLIFQCYLYEQIKGF